MSKYNWDQINAIEPAQLGKVAVLMGGASAEREVSLMSGRAVLNALQSEGVDCFSIDPKDGLQDLLDANYDRVFIALHGRGGEDGSIQGMLELIGKPYSGSDVLASALAMDKLRTKQIWESMSLPSPSFRVLTANSNWSSVMEELGDPVIVKPALEGSSIGMYKVETAAELQEAFVEAAKYDSVVFAEKWVNGPEYTVSILGDTALPVIGLETDNVIYDYEAKYLSDDTRYLLPSGLDDKQEIAIQELSYDAYKAVGCEGWGRVDLMLDEDGKPWLLEVNTVPGMTSHSLVPMAAKAAGLSFQKLVVAIMSSTLS